MKRPSFSRSHAFTLVEVMVSTLIVVILAGILISATDLTAKSFQRTSAKIEQFAEARRGFEVMTRRLSEATLNTYFDYYNDKGEPRPTLLTRRVQGVKEQNFDAFINFLPTSYGRQSELRFTSGSMEYIDPSGAAKDRPTHGVFFQAPVGEVEDRDTHGMLDHTLNSWGYFLEIDEDREYIPSILKDLTAPRRRSRLLEFRQPTERNSIYFPPYAGDPANVTIQARNWWFTEGINQTVDRPVRVVAENVIALILVPRLSRVDEVSRASDPNLNITSPDDDRGVLSPQYFYDSALTTTRVPPAQALTPTEKPEEVNPRNQLPPTVQVVMVALDENSAARLDAATPGEKGFRLDLAEIFKRSVRLEDNRITEQPDDGELKELETKFVEPFRIAPALGQQPLNYRIFNTNVIIRGAKWSRAQSK